MTPIPRQLEASRHFPPQLKAKFLCLTVKSTTILGFANTQSNPDSEQLSLSPVGWLWTRKTEVLPVSISWMHFRLASRWGGAVGPGLVSALFPGTSGGSALLATHDGSLRKGLRRRLPQTNAFGWDKGVVLPKNQTSLG